MSTMFVTAALAVDKMKPPSEPTSGSDMWAAVVLAVFLIIALSVLARFEVKDNPQANLGEEDLEADQSHLDMSDVPAPDIKSADWNELLSYHHGLRRAHNESPGKLAIGD